MADETMSATTASLRSAPDKGGPAPAPAGQPAPPEVAVPPAAPNGGAPTAGDGGEGDLAPTPSPDEPTSLAEALGKKIEQVPSAKDEHPPVTDAALKALLAERDHWKAQAEGVQERKSYRDVVEKIVSGLDKDVYDIDEVRGQLEMSMPLMKAMAEEITGPLKQEIEQLKQENATMRQQRRAQALAQARTEVNSWVTELGKDTGSGIERFIGPELDKMVGQYAAEFGLQPDSAMDSDDGYKRFVAMINTDLLAYKARRARAASARQETAEARTVPGGRSPRPNRGVTIEDLQGKSIAEQQKILRDARRR